MAMVTIQTDTEQVHGELYQGGYHYLTVAVAKPNVTARLLQTYMNRWHEGRLLVQVPVQPEKGWPQGILMHTLGRT